MAITTYTEKWEWYKSLIAAGCPPQHLGVAFMLSTHINGVKTSENFGWAWPDQRDTLAPESNRSENQVSEAIKEITSKGWFVKRVEKRGKTGARKNFISLAYGVPWEPKKRAQAPSSMNNLRNQSPNSGIGSPDTL